METSVILSCSNFSRVLDINSGMRSQSFFLHGSQGQNGQSKIQVGNSSSPYIQNGSLQYLKICPKLPAHEGRKMDFAIFCSPQHGGFPFRPPENTWTSWIVRAIAIISVAAQWLLRLKKEVDVTAETVEKIADTVEKVAEDVEKMAEDAAETLPEGGQLKNGVNFVEEAAEETARNAQFTEALMHKVEEVDKNLESLIIDTGPKDTIEVANDQR